MKDKFIKFFNLDCVNKDNKIQRKACVAEGPEIRQHNRPQYFNHKLAPLSKSSYPQHFPSLQVHKPRTPNPNATMVRTPNHKKPSYRHHCTVRSLRSPRENAWLADALTQLEGETVQIDHDWDDIMPRLNAKFGKPHRTVDEILCAIPLENRAFWAAYWKAYEEKMKQVDVLKVGCKG